MCVLFFHGLFFFLLEVLSRGELFLLDRLVQPLQEEEQRPLKTFYNRVINLKEDGLRMLLDYFLYLYRMLLGFLCLELESDDHTVPIP